MDTGTSTIDGSGRLVFMVSVVVALASAPSSSGECSVRRGIECVLH